MGRYVIINAKKSPKSIDVPDAKIQKTEYAGHAVDLITDICKNDSSAEIHIYGGDGSVFEAVNAVMASRDHSAVTLIVHPFGTGNDFVRNFPTEEAENVDIDLIRFNEHYAANEVNIGFDCDVVVMTQKIKKLPLLKGGLAYSIAAFLTLIKKMGRKFHFSFTDIDGNVHEVEDDLLLCLVANGGYYGGGFHCAPLASLSDGYLELITVKKISRIGFLKFFFGYRKGKHLNPDGTILKKYEKILTYNRIKSATFYNIENFCADGEIFASNELTVEVKEKVFRVSIAKKAK